MKLTLEQKREAAGIVVIERAVPRVRGVLRPHGNEATWRTIVWSKPRPDGFRHIVDVFEHPRRKLLLRHTAEEFPGLETVEHTRPKKTCPACKLAAPGHYVAEPPE